MAGGRHGPALFELIRNAAGGGAAARPQAPARPTPPPVVTRPEPRQAEPVAAAQEIPVERTSGLRGGGLFDFSRVISVPMSAVFLTLAVVIALLVVIWASAYKMAYERGKSEAARDLSRGNTQEAFHDIPINNDLLTQPKPDPKPPAVSPEKKPKTSEPVAPPPQPVAGGEGRVVGMNYYVMAGGLDKDGAQKIADFLTEGGLPSAIGVDRRPGGSNNPGSYSVFALKGIKPEEYKARAAARLDVEAQAARLSKVWRDKKGQQDFTQGFWQKYSG